MYTISVKYITWERIFMDDKLLQTLDNVGQKIYWSGSQSRNNQELILKELMTLNKLIALFIVIYLIINIIKIIQNRRNK